MSDLEPADVFERFAGDLKVAADQVVKTEALEAEAIAAESSAATFLDDAKAASGAAFAELSGLRRTVISAIEATSEDPEDRDALETIMLVRGVPADDIETYFSHVDRLETEQHPIAVITTTEGSLGMRGLVQVGYGRSNYHVELAKTSRMPDAREVIIPVISPRGFGVTTDRSPSRGADAVFAATPEDKSAQLVVVNRDHAFDSVHFASSAEEVDATVDRVVGADKRSIADHSAVRALNMPTIVAYGEGAVTRVAAQINERNPRLRITNHTALNNFGFEIAETDFVRREKELYRGLFRLAIEALLEERPEAESGVSFWAPLQDKVNFYPEYVPELIQRATPATYSPSLRRVVTEDFSDRQAVELELRQTAAQLRKLGVSVSGDSVNIAHSAEEVRRKAVDAALERTPGYRLLARRRIKQAA